MVRAREPLIDVRAGEGRPAVRSFLLLALIIGGHTMLETARDALFLGKLPASRLSLVYASIAGLALVVTAPNARFVRRFGEGRALVVTLAFAALGTVVLYLQELVPAIVFAIYVWSAFLGTIVVVQLWMFLARVFTPSQGKRLFGPIAAGGVTGAIAGAGLATAALTFVPVRALLLGAAGSFLLAALLSTTLAAARDARGSHDGRGARDPGGSPASSDDPAGESRVALIRRFPYVGWVAALSALSTAAVLGVDYLFKSEAARHVPAAELGAYFARSYAVFNAVALVVQVLVAGPLVQRVGVARALVVMPLLLFAGAATAIVTGAQVVVLVTKGVDGALRHSLHRLTIELLGLPIPAAVRARVKPVIEGALPRAVQAAMAALIFVLAATGLASMRALAAIVACLSLFWIAAAMALRQPHLDMFRSAIAKGNLDAARPLRLDARLVSAVVEQLASPEPERAIAAMELLVEEGAARSIPASILAHPADQVKIRALRVMRSTRRSEWAAEAERLTSTASSEDVRVAAVRALAAVRAFDAVRRCQSDASPRVRAHAAVAISSAEHESHTTSAPLLMEILATPGEQGRAGRLALLDAIRDTGHRRFAGVLLAMIDERDPELLDRAVLAMASVPDQRFIPILVSRLHVRQTRDAVRRALVNLGKPAQEAIEAALGSDATPPAVRLHLPRTISRFGNQRAADFLTRRLEIERSGLVRYKVLRGLGNLVATTRVRVDREAILRHMRQNLVRHIELLARWVPLERDPCTHESQGGRLVLGLLADKLRQSLDRAFRLLSIANPGEDIRDAYLALGSGDRRARSNALEFLDALTTNESGPLGREIRDLLLLVVDDLPPEEKVLRARARLSDPPSDVTSALRLLVREHDTALAALAAFHGQELGIPGVVSEAEERARDRPSLAEMASALLEPPPGDVDPTAPPSREEGGDDAGG